ncbi:MAG: 5-deoxy-glucuronate isomerase [bacterium]
MQIIDADESRMIDLPGVGPCPRPVDIDQRQTGFSRLKSLRIYRFQPGPSIHGESEGDEVFIVPLGGAFEMTITGAHPFHGRLSAEGPGRALYMTPDHAYRLAPLGPVTVAYARAEAAGRVRVQPVGGQSVGLAERLRFRRVSPKSGSVLEVGGEEMLIHIVSGAVGHAGTRVVGGQTLALRPDETALLHVNETTDLLIVSA